jgi:hypothetical protein
LPDGQIAHTRHAKIARRANLSRVLAVARYPKSQASSVRPASMKRGVTADRHETWVRDAMDAGGVERAHVARTNDADADGEVVWSWRQALFFAFHRSIKRIFANGLADMRRQRKSPAQIGQDLIGPYFTDFRICAVDARDFGH